MDGLGIQTDLATWLYLQSHGLTKW